MGLTMANGRHTPPRQRDRPEEAFPHDPDIERALVGAALQIPEPREALAAQPDDFIWDARLRHVRDAIVAIHNDGIAVDKPLVLSRLRSAGLSSLIPDAFVADCARAAGLGLGWEAHHAEALELHRRRQAIRHATAMSEAARLGSWHRYDDLAKRTPEPPSTARRTLTARPVHDLLAHPPPRRPVILDGLLRQGELMVVVAEASVGKSWWCMQMALHLADGHGDFLGFAVRQESSVLYWHGEMDEEGAYDRWRILIGDGTIPAHIADIYDPFVISVVEEQTQDGPRRTRRHIADGFQPLERRISEDRPDVVVLDTWGGMFGGDENDKQQVQTVVSELDRLARTYECSVVIVHHYRKARDGVDPFDAARGSTRLIDAAHTRIVISPHYTAKTAASAGLDEETARRFADVRVRRRVGRKPPTFHMQFDPDSCRWTLWDAPDEPAVRGDARPRSVSTMALVRTVVAVAERLGGTIASTNQLMKEAGWRSYDKAEEALESAVRMGAVTRGDGPRRAKQYHLVDGWDG